MRLLIFIVIAAFLPFQATAFLFGLLGGGGGAGCSCPPTCGAPSPSPGCAMLCPQQAAIGCQQQQNNYGFPAPAAQYPAGGFSFPTPQFQQQQPSFNIHPPRYNNYAQPQQQQQQQINNIPLPVQPLQHQQYLPRAPPIFERQLNLQPVGYSQPQVQQPQEFVPPAPSRPIVDNQAPVSTNTDPNPLPASFYNSPSQSVALVQPEQQPQLSLQPPPIEETSQLETQQVEVAPPQPAQERYEQKTTYTSHQASHTSLLPADSSAQDIAQSIEESYDERTDTEEEERKVEVPAAVSQPEPYKATYQTPVKTTEFKIPIRALAPEGTRGEILLVSPTIPFTEEILPEEETERVYETTKTAILDYDTPKDELPPPQLPVDTVEPPQYSPPPSFPLVTSSFVFSSTPLTVEYQLPNTGVTYGIRPIATTTIGSVLEAIQPVEEPINEEQKTDTVYPDVTETNESPPPPKNEYKTVTRNEGKSSEPPSESGYDVTKIETTVKEERPDDDGRAGNAEEVEEPDNEAEIPNRTEEYTQDETQTFSKKGPAENEVEDSNTGESYSKKHRAADTGKSDNFAMALGKVVEKEKENGKKNELTKKTHQPNSSENSSDKVGVASHKARDPSVTKCNSARLRDIMHEKMSSSAPVSKQLIYSSASAAFPGLSLDVICSRHSFSYIVVTSPVYCEHRKTPLTCFAFFQP